MEYIRDYQRPDLESPALLFAFAGWADAAESATHALRYMVKRLGATHFASIDPEEFYDFTQARPHTIFDKDGNRQITWPANDFYSWKGQSGEADLVIFLGTEPNLKWRTFSGQILSMVRELGVSRAMQVGALLDAVPHTRDPRITGTATSPELQELLTGVEVRRSRYTGPTGISGVLGDVLRREGIPMVSLWGHSPHYLHVSPNPKGSLGLVQAMERVLKVDVDLGPLRSQGSKFDRRVAQTLSNETEIIEYIKRLENQYDSLVGGGGTESVAMPEPEQAVQDMEEFLKQLRDDAPSEPSTGQES